MKIVLDHFVQFNSGAVLDLNEFKGITVEAADGAKERFVIKFVSSTTQSLYGSMEEVQNLSSDFIGLYNDWKNGKENPLAPPKGYIDVTQESFSGNFNLQNVRILIKANDICEVQEQANGKTVICSSSGAQSFEESYDTIIERLKEASK